MATLSASYSQGGFQMDTPEPGRVAYIIASCGIRITYPSARGLPIEWKYAAESVSPEKCDFVDHEFIKRTA